VISDEQIDLILDGLESLCAQLARNASETIARWAGVAESARPGRTADDKPTPLLPPARRPAGSRRRRWAFLVHYTRPDDVRVTEPGLERLSPAELEAFCRRVGALPPGLCLRAPVVRSPATGVEAEGFVIALPLLPEEMLRRGRRRWAGRSGRGGSGRAPGGGGVGLGGFTTPLSERGKAVVGRGPWITTGNALTAAAAFRAAVARAEAAGRRLGEARVAVLGARGSVGALLARMAARERPAELVLLGNPSSDTAALEALAGELAAQGVPAVASTDARRLAGCDLVLSATGAARPILDGLPIAAGAIVCDVARPPDAGPVLRGRADVTVVDGGVVALPDPGLAFGPGNLQGLPPGLALACLAETIVHALEGTAADFGVGDDVPLAEADSRPGAGGAARVPRGAARGSWPRPGARVALGGGR
jgi:predicted amino acid dehydrogenase